MVYMGQKLSVFGGSSWDRTLWTISSTSCLLDTGPWTKLYALVLIVRTLPCLGPCCGMQGRADTCMNIACACEINLPVASMVGTREELSEGKVQDYVLSSPSCRAQCNVQGREHCRRIPFCSGSSGESRSFLHKGYGHPFAISPPLLSKPCCVY